METDTSTESQLAAGNETAAAKPVNAAFLFVACQAGAERALKGEIARTRPEFRFAYSRPGFVTFKLPEGHALTDDLSLPLVFARTFGFSLGKAAGDTDQARAESVWRLAEGIEPAVAHLWQREEPRKPRVSPASPQAESEMAGSDDEGSEPASDRSAGETAESPSNAAAESPEPAAAPQLEAARIALAATAPSGLAIHSGAADEAPAPFGSRVLDVILVEPNEWWVGCHRARSGPSRHPGGRQRTEPAPHAVSRAYYKMAEALRWSKLPVRAGQKCVELGSAPGGAAQYLLEQGLNVLGVDPARMDPAVANHPRFQHINKRGKEVRRRELAGVEWLVSDMNVAPNYTLDCVEDIVSHRDMRIEGMILTLKLIDWELADCLDEYLERIRGWGFRDVRARQLAHNRQEVCVAALRRQHMRDRPS